MCDFTGSGSECVVAASSVVTEMKIHRARHATQGAKTKHGHHSAKPKSALAFYCYQLLGTSLGALGTDLVNTQTVTRQIDQQREFQGY